jgi:glutamate-ammonia-ligase adenylyltransferase
MTELPLLTDYSALDLLNAEWPAIRRYRELITRAPQNQSDRIRLRRHQAWLRCALATALERAPAATVCKFWSDQARILIREAWELSGFAGGRFCLVALGKLGAEELNLSSDVDLMIVRDDGAPPDMKAFREFQSLLSDLTSFGYCLRVDFTLRPGGRSAAAIPSESEFQNYYGYHGEMWERLAFVRFRILEGPEDLSQSLLHFAQKFSFRRHLDYTLLDELKALRSKIRKENAESKPSTFHLKLGEGGIRELELFVHALQIIHGGRDTALRAHTTSNAIEQIRSAKLLPAAECDFLLHSYWHLRTIENRIHAWDDLQTYTVDLEGAHPALPGDFSPALVKTCRRVNEIASSLFGSDRGELVVPESPDAQKTWLRERGFSEHSQTHVWPDLLAATALSRKTESDERARLSFLFGFVTKLSEIGLDRDLGLSLLLDFVRATRAKASFFTLLNREPRIRDQLASLFSISPYLGSILCSRPELIDAFILRRQAEASTDLNSMLEELAERRLVAELISASRFLADKDLSGLLANLSDNADSICGLLLQRLIYEHNATQINLVAMGKWGGRELGLRSDLDFIFVSPGEPSAAESSIVDQKIARRFLSRMTEPHRGGSIYAVDMRLRPSGSAGPILVFESELKRYLIEDAAAWERQAYLRARPLEPLSFHPAQIASERGLNDNDRVALAHIRKDLFSSSTPTELDLKLNYGGLADIEFTVQIALLSRREFSLDPSTSSMIQYLESVDSSWRSIGSELRQSYEGLRRLEQLYQLTTSQSGAKLRTKSEEFKRLALVESQTPEELTQNIYAALERSRNLLATVSIIKN